MFHKGDIKYLYIFLCSIVYTVHTKHICLYVCLYIYIYISYVCVLFTTGYYTDAKVYQIIDTVQCKRVYLSAKGVLSRPEHLVPLLGTMFVCEWVYMCVLCWSIFAACWLFWNFVHFLYFVQKTKLISRPSEQQHPHAVVSFFPSSSSSFFCCIFFFTSPVQYNDKLKLKAFLWRVLHCSAYPAEQPSLSGPAITHHAFVVPFRQQFAMLYLRKAKVGGLWTCQSSTWKWVKDRGNQSKSWEEEHEAWRQGDQCQAHVDKKVGAVMYFTRSSTTRAPPPLAPLQIWGRNNWLMVIVRLKLYVKCSVYGV